MNYLVTGGSGFIGSHLVERLLDDTGNRVTVLDRWLSDESKNQQSRPNFTFVEGGVVSDDSFLEELCDEADVVYHLASILGTSETVDIYDVEDVANTNIIGTIRVLKASLRTGVKRVVYPATPDVPWLNPYKITKVACERFCQMFTKEYGLDTAILVLPNVYGPRERWIDCDWGAPFNYQKVVPTFIIHALRNARLPIFGDGQQKAEYLHVDDVARAFVLAGEKDGIAGEAITLGPGNPISVVDLAHLVNELTDNDSDLEFLPMRSGEVKLDIRVDPDIGAKHLGFTPDLDLREGLQRTIKYYASVI